MSERSAAPRASAVASAIATCSGNLYLVLATLVLATLAVMVSWVPPRGYFTFRLARIWSRGLLVASGMRLRVRRHPGVDRRNGYVFMANHRSLFDIPALLVSLPGQTRFLAKSSLFRIPIFGWAIALGGFVNIDRQNLSTARDSFAAAIDRLGEGVSLLVFPEGTRSASGRMLPFKRGGFLLALKSGRPIVPVGIAGSGPARRPGSYRIRPCEIRVHYGRPIEMDRFSVRDKQRLMQAVADEIEKLIATEAPAPGTTEP